MALETLRNLSVNELMSKLYHSISTAAQNIGRIVEGNKQIGTNEIIELREHIKDRLQANENVEINQKLLKMIELFRDNKDAIALLKIDLEEWLTFLDALKENLQQSPGGMSQDEAKKIESLQTEITKIQDVLRGESEE